MAGQFSAIVAGLVCLDFSPALTGPVGLLPGQLHQVGPLRLDPGGCVANTGGDLAALGGAVRLVGEIGDDALGSVLTQLLADRDDGAVLRLFPVTGAATSYTIVVQPLDTDRTLWHHIGANAFFDGSRIDLDRADLIHIGYPPLLPALIRDDARALRGLLQRARKAGLTTSLDLAVADPAAAAEGPDWARLLPLLGPSVDVLTPSVDDLQSLLHRSMRATPDGLAAAAGELLAAGVAVVALSAGPAGITLRTAGRERLAGGGRVVSAAADSWADQTLHVPAAPVPTVRTTGAGDAATAGLLFGLLEGLGPRPALRLAAAAAAAHVRGDARLAPYSPSTSWYQSVSQS